jgi:TatD DNase family protein
MKYIDIHCHLNLDEYNLDIQETIKRANDLGVGMIVVGVDIESSKRAIKIAEENENIWACIGLHPADDPKEVFDFDIYRKLAEHPKVVAIGETGFDYYHMQTSDTDRQREIFEKHITIANEVNKPLMLHIRNGVNGGDAYGDAIASLKKHAKVHGDVHFFAGSLEQAKEFINLGFKISFTGVITFTRDYDEVIQNIPLNMIMSETDSPFVTPVPYRGQRNEPGYVIEVVNKIAEIRGEDMGMVREQLVNNAKTLFKI